MTTPSVEDVFTRVGEAAASRITDRVFELFGNKSDPEVHLEKDELSALLALASFEGARYVRKNQ